MSSFNFNANVSDSNAKAAKISATGKVKTDKKGWTFKGTDGDINIEVIQLDLETLESILDLAKIDLQVKGIINSNLKGALKDGQLQNITGNLNASKIDVTGEMLKGDRIQTEQVNMTLNLSSQKDIINIENLTLTSDMADAQIKGSVPTNLDSIEEMMSGDSAMDLNGNFAVNVATILSQLPNTIGLKKGLVVTSGKLNGNIATSSLAGKRVLNANANLTNLAGKLDDTDIRLSPAFGS